MHDFFQQVDVRMLAGMGARVGNMFGKPYQTLLCRFFVQFSAKTFRQGIVQLERTELALNGGNVVNRFAVGIPNVQTGQMIDGRECGEIVLEIHISSKNQSVSACRKSCRPHRPSRG